MLRVRLFGPAGARIAQATRIEGIDEQIARQRLPEVDAARAQYVRRFTALTSTIRPCITCRSTAPCCRWTPVPPR